MHPENTNRIREKNKAIVEPTHKAKDAKGIWANRNITKKENQMHLGEELSCLKVERVLI